MERYELENNNNKDFFFAVFFIAADLVAIAQPPASPPPPGGGSTGTDPPCWDPECIPIDGGVGFLIAAGAALGIRKVYNKKNKNEV